MFSRLGELLGGRVVTLLALAALAATLAHPAVAQAPARKVVESAGDLARFNYPISGTATALVTADDATFAPFAAKVRADVDEVLADYDIKDHAALKRVLTVRLGLQMLSGSEDKAALRTIDQIRDLEDKPDVKLLSNMVNRAVLQARAATGQTSGAAYQAAYAKAYQDAVTPLPWAIVGNRVKEIRSGQQIVSTAWVIGSIQSDVEPALLASKALGDDLAWGLIRQRLLLKVSLPVKDATLAVLGRYIAAHDVARADIWQARDVDLSGETGLTPVVVAIWDSGTDLSLFPGRVYTDPHPAAGADAHGLAFDVEGRPTHGDLLPLDPTQVGDYAGAIADLIGKADLDASIDSPESDSLKKRLSSMSPAQSSAFFERLELYGDYSHGTHVAGIAARGNPAIRLAVARMTFDWRDVPIMPTEALTRRLAASDAASVAWFKAHRVRVVNISWNGDAEGVEADLEKNGFGASAEARKAEARRLFAIRRDNLYAALRDAPDVLFICSAGNSGADAVFSEDMPASFRLPNLLVVGATDQAGEEASFTSYGDTVRVDADGYQVESVLPGGVKVRYSGTSQAAPNVANLAAKLLAIDPRLTPTDVIQLIIEGATPSADGRLHNINPKRSVELLRARMAAPAT